ncbi:MAG: GTPase domain-containing protein, partial [Thiohalocapsa sp.]
MQDALEEQARAWVDADAPILWLLGKTQAGKTSIVAEMTDQGYDEVGRGYRPMTLESRIYAFPPQQPVLRFLDTRGLADSTDNDPDNELAQAREQAHLLVAVLRVDDQDVAEIIDAVDQARRRHRRLPVIVAQTGLHRCYSAHDRHADPYPFDGSDDDTRRPGVPHQLSRVMLAQRKLFERISGAAPLFVPLDFTRPEQGIAPADYGAERLWDLLEQTLPE